MSLLSLLIYSMHPWLIKVFMQLYMCINLSLTARSPSCSLIPARDPETNTFLIIKSDKWRSLNREEVLKDVRNILKMSLIWWKTDKPQEECDLDVNAEHTGTERGSSHVFICDCSLMSGGQRGSWWTCRKKHLINHLLTGASAAGKNDPRILIRKIHFSTL